jgi:CDP-paratose 2-epimerase
MKILITGAGGLIGSEAVEYYCNQGHQVYGIENNQRAVFFGPKGSTLSRLSQLELKYSNFKNFNRIKEYQNYEQRISEKITEIFKFNNLI